jgi:hypothetical protein
MESKKKRRHQLRTLSFDPVEHRYFLTEDETGDVWEIPSVSRIVNAVLGKDLSKIPKKNLEAARDRGLMIHKDVETARYETPEGKWIGEKISGLDIRSEQMGWTVFDGIEFAGTCDILTDAEIKDIKSQAVKDIMGWTVQINLYGLIWPRNIFSVLHTPKSGDYNDVKIIPLSSPELTRIFEAYKTGEVLDTIFIEERKTEEKNISLDLVVTSHDKGGLVCNSKTLLANVREKMKQYSADNYSEDNIDEAVKDKAILNASAKTIDDVRIKYEREHMEAISAELSDLKQAVLEIKAGVACIDPMIKAVKTKAQERKKGLIREYFTGLEFTLVTFDRLFDEKWLNKGEKLEDCKNALLAKTVKIQSDLIVLDGLGEPDAKKSYLTTLNLEGVIAEAARLKENAKILEDAKETKNLFTDNPVIEKPLPVPVKPPVPSSGPSIGFGATKVPVESFTEAPELLERTMRVWASLDDLIWISSQMNERGIRFQKIEGGVL